MKAFANLLVVVSLVVAVVGAVTAYIPPLSQPDERLVGLHLASGAGRRADDHAKPIVPDKTRLTAEHIAELRAAGVKRVHVREFSFARWSGALAFLIGCAGLLFGGLTIRGQRRSAAQAAQAGGSGQDAASILQEIRAIVEGLRRELPAMPTEGDFKQATIERLGRIQRDLVPAFVAARPAIIASGGLSKYAQVMDRLATGERQINRAWSAAADGYLGDVMPCLGSASELLEAAAERLARP